MNEEEKLNPNIEFLKKKNPYRDISEKMSFYSKMYTTTGRSSSPGVTIEIVRRDSPAEKEWKWIEDYNIEMFTRKESS